MRSLYLSHLIDIADGSHHALVINSRICATFCILPLALDRYTRAPANVTTNTTSIPCTIGTLSFLGVIHKIFQLELATPKHAKGKAKLADKVVRKSCVCMWPAATALNYSIKDIRNDVR